MTEEAAKEVKTLKKKRAAHKSVVFNRLARKFDSIVEDIYDDDLRRRSKVGTCFTFQNFKRKRTNFETA